MEQRIEVAKIHISEGKSTSLTLKICKISRSTWYDRVSSIEGLLGSTKSKGRPTPGFTKNKDGTYLLDSTIISTLKKYREDENFKNSGGYQKLKHYLRRDFGFFINGKKLYRLCKENKGVDPDLFTKSLTSNPSSAKGILTPPLY